ncbi:AAA family ATPase [Bryobacter aggregatus]|uniref:AAA family ATPase n=1 Tax=Bryobacter aggregatus TaxID=360054 RepID=UPI000A823870|nr:AAA family ATPase [Bryobacter aggregatus]
MKPEVQIENGSERALEDKVTLHPLNYGRRILGLTMEPRSMRTALDPKRTGKDASYLEYRLRQLVAGQEDAISQIVNMFQMFTTGLNAPGRPIGSFLFLGPTGTGKTRLVEAAAECLLRRPSPIIKIDCAEFQHSHEIAKLIGSPPGYLGHRETHPILSQEVLNQYWTDEVKLSFVLFDEIEKASDSLWNLLLGILDKGVMTLGDNRKVDFSRAMIFMTSNLGAHEMNQIGNPKMGFAQAFTGQSLDAAVQDEKRNRTGLEAARRKFTPEFMNRLDKVVVFKSLSDKDLRRILDIELAIFQHRLLAGVNQKKFVFGVSDEAKAFLLEQGLDPRYGARHLKRSMERLLVQPLSNLLATQQIEDGDCLRIDYDPLERELTFTKEAEGLPIGTMFDMIDTSVPVQLGTLAAAVANEQPKYSSAAAMQKQRSRT